MIHAFTVNGVGASTDIISYDIMRKTSPPYRYDGDGKESAGCTRKWRRGRRRVGIEVVAKERQSVTRSKNRMAVANSNKRHLLHLQLLTEKIVEEIDKNKGYKIKEKNLRTSSVF